MEAAAAVAAALGLRRPRAAAAAAATGRPAASKKQRQLTLQGAGGEGAGPGQRQQQQPQQHQHAQQQQEVNGGMRDAGPRPEERALLAHLYPPVAAAVVAGAAAAGQPQRTPKLASDRSLARATPAGASLWAGAGACQPVAPTLGARLAQREGADPAASAARRQAQPLARGGATYPTAPDQESRALKRVKLEALREELRTHESTVAELRRMIAGLEREVESGGSGGGCGGCC
jgi:hypothetical protein